MDTQITKLQNKFVKFLPKEFPNLLFQHKSIIAGGSIVQTFLGNIINDYDIFVGINSSLALIKDLIGLGYSIQEKEQEYGSHYKNKLRSCHIFMVIKMVKKDGEKIIEKPLDIIIVGMDPKMVVTKFDLSCCMTYYDGKQLYISKPKDFFNKICYYYPNRFDSEVFDILLARISKYQARGFDVRFLPNFINIVNDECSCYFCQIKLVGIDIPEIRKCIFDLADFILDSST